MKRDEDHSYNYSNISFGSAPERTRRGEKNGTTKDGRRTTAKKRRWKRMTGCEDRRKEKRKE